MLKETKMDNRINLPIAVIDSGVGGVSVLRELIKIMPEERFLYFGDSKNAPYGTKSREEVLEITKNNLETLKKRGIKALVVACNTATSAAVRILREENPDLPIVGIEPAVKPASKLCEHPKILVMATPLTLKEEKFRALVARFEDKGEFIPLPCGGLADLVETGDVDGDEIKNYLTKLFEPYQNEKIDGIVLGCTHYPHVKHVIDGIWENKVAILDGGEGTARETRRRLSEKGLLRQGVGEVEIVNTSGDEKMIEITKKLLYR